MYCYLFIFLILDLEAIEGDCGGSLEKIVNETCKTLYYEFPEQS